MSFPAFPPGGVDPDASAVLATVGRSSPRRRREVSGAPHTSPYFRGASVLSAMTGARDDGERFRDREEAGRRLGGDLRDLGVAPDVVLAIPRGGLPVGRAVADALGCPLDVVVASKLSAPGNPEFAIGAVGSDGATWLDESAVAGLGVSEEYVERERERELAAAREKADRYRAGDAVDLTDRTVLVVDDGLATGSTATAAVQVARRRDAARVVVAVPVGSQEAVDRLEETADAVVCLRTPAVFGAVGAFYDRFPQVGDEAAIAYLRGDPS